MRKWLFILLLFSFHLQGQNFTYPAEYEKHDALFVVWDYSESINPVTANLVAAVQDHAHIYIIYYPGTVPYDTTYIRDYMADFGVGNYNYTFIPAWTETKWIRDFGPFIGYTPNSTADELRMVVDAKYSAYNRPKDDSIPSQLANNIFNFPVTDLPLDFEGGNILFDGLGRAFGGRRIAWQNPDYTDEEVAEMIKDHFGLYDFVYMEALENSGGGIWAHVDMFMKIIDNETILITEFPENHPDYEVIEANVNTIKGLSNYLGRPYTVHRIPFPPNSNGQIPTTQNAEMRTYANSLIMNDVVVVPSYGIPLDAEAKEIYENLYPGKTVEMVNCVPLTPQYGAIHCITNELPPQNLLRILHPKMVGEQSNNQVEIISLLQTNEAVDLEVHYQINNENYQSELMVLQGQTYSYTFNIEDGDTVAYYLQACIENDCRNEPFDGALAPHVFWLLEDDEPIDSTGVSSTTLASNTKITFFDNQLNISGLENKVWRAKIYTIDGKQLSNFEFLGNSYSQYFSLPSGLYFLKLEKENEYQTVKFWVD